MTGIITTKQAECKDCYRCLRVCPVKAIIFTTEKQAKVNEERCILCGNCVVECPQHAKKIRNQVFKVQDYLSCKEKTVLSIAPSFPASFDRSFDKIQESLLKLGFAAVEETAVGACFTTEGYRKILSENPDRTWLSSCCPVIVNLIEKYYPELVKNLMPIASPMVAHTRYFKSKYGEHTKVVFAGPCIAKLKEAEENGVDVAITFSQLKEFMLPDAKQEVQELKAGKELKTRMFPVHFGVLYALKGYWSMDEELWSVDGIDQCREVLEALKNKDIQPKFIELMACQGGCIGGPAIDSPHSRYKRRHMITEYCHYNSKIPLSLNEKSFLMERRFTGQPVIVDSFNEEEIRAVLIKMGKYSPEDERNCEGCGYKSCRDKAIAVLSGLAVPEMCIPNMRAKAESFGYTIVQKTPNAIIILDENMALLDYNPAAKHLFKLQPIYKDLKMSTIVDTKNYECVLRTGSMMEVDIIYPEWEQVTHQVIIPLEESKQVMVIITDITKQEEHKLQMQRMKEDVMTKAKEVINRQMNVVQTIAGLLGETTAETKATLTELLKHLESE